MLYQIIFNNSQESFSTGKVFQGIYRLPSAGEVIVPFLVEEDNSIKELVLNLTKTDQGEYWNLETIAIDTTNLWIFTISDKYSPITFNFSILTFYISIIYFARRLIRLFTNDSGMNVVKTDMKNPEHLNTLCSWIYASRMIGNLEKEEVLYYELIDILRSPDITKALRGKSSIKSKKT